MKRYLLDTNIISHAIKPNPAPSFLTWMTAEADEDLFIASFTVAEIRRGILEKSAGQKRTTLETWFAGPQGPQSLFAGRILAFEEQAALVWAALIAEGKEAGRPRDPLDMIIASVGIANGCAIVTDNERDFWGIEIFNPLRG